MTTIAHEQLMGENGLELEYCPTCILRDKLHKLQLNTNGLTRTECIHHLQLKGYHRLCNKNTSPKTTPCRQIERIESNFDNTVSFRDNFVFQSENSIEIHSQSHGVYNPIYDQSVKFLSTKYLYSLDHFYLQNNELFSVFENAKNQLCHIESSYDLLLNPSNPRSLPGIEANLSYKFKSDVYQQFDNIKTPFINLHAGKGLFLEIEKLSNNKLAFDYNNSYIYIKDHQTLYDITIEIRDLQWFNKSYKTNKVVFELLDINLLQNKPTNIRFDNNEFIVAPYLFVNEYDGQWQTASTPGVQIQAGKISIWAPRLTTADEFDQLLYKKDIPFTIRFSYISRKKSILSNDTVSPYFVSKQQTEQVRLIRANVPMDIVGTHYWIDGIDRVVLYTDLKLNLHNLDLNHDVITIVTNVPNEYEIEHHHTDHICPYTGTGKLHGNDVSVQLDKEFGVSRLMIQLPSSIIKTKQVCFQTNITYNLISKTFNYISPQIDVTVSGDTDRLTIADIKIYDSINVNGGLELNEYYEINHVIQEVNLYVYDLEPDISYDVYSFADGIHVSNLSITNTFANHLFTAILTDSTPAYEFRTFPYVPHIDVPDGYVLNIQKSTVFNKGKPRPGNTTFNYMIRYSQIESIIDVYTPINPSSLNILVYQTTTLETQQEDITYEITDAQTLTVNINNTNDIIPSYNYVRVFNTQERVNKLLDVVEGYFDQSESMVIHELGEFDTIIYNTSQ